VCEAVCNWEHTRGSLRARQTWTAERTEAMGSMKKERLFARLFFWSSQEDPQREIAFRVHAKTEDNKDVEECPDVSQTCAKTLCRIWRIGIAI
jgi:hypothetical protein